MAIDPNLITTQSVGELPPVPATEESLIPHELAGVLNHTTIAQLIALTAPLVGKMQFECVDMVVDAAYISDNFDNTGLGKNLCVGFAIRNGNNGTDNADGCCDIGYGTTYSAIGAFGGSPDAVVVKHSHTVKLQQLNSNSDVGSGKIATGDQYPEGGIPDIQTEETGVSGKGKNMPPYRVVLKIMKL